MQVTPAFAKPPGTVTNEFLVLRGHSRMQMFGNNMNLNPAVDVNDRVTKLLDGSGKTTGWTVYNANNDSTEYFDVNGKLVKVVERNGQQKNLTYSDVGTPITVAPKTGMLIRVTNTFGQQLNFTYDGGGRMLTMTDPAGGVTTYEWSAPIILEPGQPPLANLNSVTYPDGKKITYWYNEQDKTAGTDLPFSLTGITDENGVRFATWNYDAKGRAISSEHAGGVEKYTLTGYDTSQSPTVTDPFGVSTSSNYYPVLDQMRIIEKVRTGGGDTVRQQTRYDVNGNPFVFTDYDGTRTYYQYDLTRNLKILQVNAYGTAESQTTTTSWHPLFRIPVQVNTPLLRTTYVHDIKGNVLTKTLQATSDTDGSQGANAIAVGSPRVWTYTYNDVGQILSVTGPRTDLVDKTSYVYDNAGNLTSIINAAGHVTTLSQYDGNGRPGQITDPNGQITTLTYKPRGWLSKMITSGDGSTQTTSYDYDNVGQMTLVTLPDNSSISYRYDDAHRLTKISDSLGNSINYTLDNMGNRINETVTDSSGTLTRQVKRVYDALNRLQKVTGAAQ